MQKSGLIKTSTLTFKSSTHWATNEDWVGRILVSKIMTSYPRHSKIQEPGLGMLCKRSAQDTRQSTRAHEHLDSVPVSGDRFPHMTRAHTWPEQRPSHVWHIAIRETLRKRAWLFDNWKLGFMFLYTRIYIFFILFMVQGECGMPAPQAVTRHFITMQSETWISRWNLNIPFWAWFCT